MSECNHDCSNCSANCGSRKEPQSLLVPQNEASDIKKVIGVVSGKGGVGKSMVTSLLAIAMNRAGKKTALMDADVTGPSIPKMFGLKDRIEADDKYMYPAKTLGGIEVMSLNLMVENETDPVIWRGPVIAGLIQQFWKDVKWGDVDFMFIDMPPGTGDVPLTVFQSIKLDGIIIAATPQELVSMIVSKAANMAKMMNIPIIGVVENMSYLKCPHCGEAVDIFGKSHTAEAAAEYGVPLLDCIPLDPALAGLSDAGSIEKADTTVLNHTIETIMKL
ncbi:MAG: Mrp/NBP35 family ATP-binding protein [Anaerolineaceae bacterium]|nr:Mrp/NBP35 family ATP-binding protein [Anaerolineaceae bacterium]